jgi:hypothetical protein
MAKIARVSYSASSAVIRKKRVALQESIALDSAKGGPTFPGGVITLGDEKGELLGPMRLRFDQKIRGPAPLEVEALENGQFSTFHVHFDQGRRFNAGGGQSVGEGSGSKPVIRRLALFGTVRPCGRASTRAAVSPWQARPKSKLRP